MRSRAKMVNAGNVVRKSLIIYSLFLPDSRSRYITFVATLSSCEKERERDMVAILDLRA